MKPIGSPLNNPSPELQAASDIVQGKDRSSEKLNELIRLQRQASESDKTKIGNLIEAFLASE